MSEVGRRETEVKKDKTPNAGIRNGNSYCFWEYFLPTPDFGLPSLSTMVSIKIAVVPLFFMFKGSGLGNLFLTCVSWERFSLGIMQTNPSNSRHPGLGSATILPAAGRQHPGSLSTLAPAERLPQKLHYIPFSANDERAKNTSSLRAKRRVLMTIQKDSSVDTSL